MKHSILAVTLLLSLTMLGCSKKEDGSSDKAGVEATSADLPAECQLFMEQVESLSSCDKIPKASQAGMKAGYQQMMKSMIKNQDPKMIKGCIDGQKAIALARSTAGC